MCYFTTVGNTTITESSFESRGDLDCPGDRFLYNCSVLFNDEAVNRIMWRITLPGDEPLNITLNRTVLTDFGIEITAELTEYERLPPSEASHIESVLTIVLLSNVTAKGTIGIECGTNSNLYNDSVTLPIDLSG